MPLFSRYRSGWWDSIKDNPLLPVFLFLPLWQKVLPLCIALAVIQAIREGIGFRELLKKTLVPSLGLQCLFVVYLLSVLYSQNQSRAWQDIETKLSLFLIPLVFALRRNRTDPEKAFTLLIIGLLCMASFCEVRAVFYYLMEKSGRQLTEYPLYYDVFFGSYFCPFIHHSYMSLYCLCAMLFLLEHMRTKGSKPRDFLLAAALLVFQIQLLSRAGLLVLILCMTVYLAIYIRSIKKWILPGLLFAFLLALAGNFTPMGLKLQQQVKEILAGTGGKNKPDPATTSSVEVRPLIWSRAVSLIKEQPLMGTGNGDSRDALRHAYKEYGMTGALEKNLNCHNQYLETQLSIGLLGTLVLLATLFAAVLSTIKKKQVHLLLVVMGIALAMLAESMLEVQAGTIFISLFFSMLPEWKASRH